MAAAGLTEAAFEFVFRALPMGTVDCQACSLCSVGVFPGCIGNKFFDGVAQQHADGVLSR